MRFEGKTGLHADKMGEYTMQCQKNEGYPVYTMERPGNKEVACLFRTHNGKWMVGEASDMPKNRGWLLSDEADLPSKAGLNWRYWEDDEWKSSDKIVARSES